MDYSQALEYIEYLEIELDRAREELKSICRKCGSNMTKDECGYKCGNCGNINFSSAWIKENCK